MENAEKTTSTESKTTTEEKTLKPPIAQLIGLEFVFLWYTWYNLCWIRPWKNAFVDNTEKR